MRKDLVKIIAVGSSHCDICVRKDDDGIWRRYRVRDQIYTFDNAVFKDYEEAEDYIQYLIKSLSKR